MAITLTVLGVVIGAVLFYIIAVYNGLVAKRNNVREAWSDIDVQMKRRYDLVPNLVETVKGYAAHEAETLENVIKARNIAMNDHGDPAHQARSENMLESTLKTLFAVSEAYPQLQANQSFLKLQAELAEIEETIQKARRYYNGNVRDLNNAVEQFPSNIVAGLFAFEQRTFFELDSAQAAAREPVPVKF